MQREAPDTHFYAEISDFNLEFLGLVAQARQRCHGAVFGLDTAVVEQVSRMNPAQLEAMAEAPCLLAGFAAGRGNRPARIAEPAPTGDPEWAGHARLFAAGLLTYAWQMARRDSLRAALCIGPDAHRLAGNTSLRDIRGYADRALQHLEARFRAHARFWPDLVRATRDGRPERLLLARLTAIQLATLEASQGTVRRDLTATLLSGTAGAR